MIKAARKLAQMAEQNWGCTLTTTRKEGLFSKSSFQRGSDKGDFPCSQLLMKPLPMPTAVLIEDRQPLHHRRHRPLRTQVFRKPCQGKPQAHLMACWGLKDGSEEAMAAVTSTQQAFLCPGDLQRLIQQSSPATAPPCTEGVGAPDTGPSEAWL